MAELVSTRATCIRRSVGCVLVDARKHVLATGYNGVAAGLPHCNMYDPLHETGYPHACKGAFMPHGTGLDCCQAIHAEQNALLQCKDVYEIDTCYVTTTPCIHCTKLLLNTSCKTIVAPEVYDKEAVKFWVDAGRELVLVDKSTWKPLGEVHE